MIRMALLALVLGLLLTASVMASVQEVPALSRMLFALGLSCLAGSVAIGIWVRPRSQANQRPRR